MEFYPRPLVLVVDSAARDLTGNMLLASLSTGNLLFDDAGAVRSAFENASAGDVISSVDRAADAGLLRAQLLSQTLWLRWVSLGLVLAALASSTAIGASVWARKISRRVFVLRTAGHSWMWIARRRLVWEAASASLMTVLGGFFLLRMSISPLWVILIPAICFPLSAALHQRALENRFRALILRSG